MALRAARDWIARSSRIRLADYFNARPPRRKNRTLVLWSEPSCGILPWLAIRLVAEGLEDFTFVGPIGSPLLIPVGCNAKVREVVTKLTHPLKLNRVYAEFSSAFEVQLAVVDQNAFGGLALRDFKGFLR
jgi:hypothetical protein